MEYMHVDGPLMTPDGMKLYPQARPGLPEATGRLAARNRQAARAAALRMVADDTETDVPEELLTPEQWCARFGVMPLDHDGWRTPGADWRRPIPLAEFHERIRECTITPAEGEDAGRLIDLMTMMRPGKDD